LLLIDQVPIEGKYILCLKIGDWEESFSFQRYINLPGIWQVANVRVRSARKSSERRDMKFLNPRTEKVLKCDPTETPESPKPL